MIGGKLVLRIGGLDFFGIFGPVWGVNETKFFVTSSRKVKHRGKIEVEGINRRFSMGWFQEKIREILEKFSHCYRRLSEKCPGALYSPPIVSASRYGMVSTM